MNSDYIAMLKHIPPDFPVTERPYGDIAEKAEMSETELIELLEHMLREGVIRRIGAIISHRDASYTGNVMVAWKVAEQDIEKTGNAMAGFHEVTHCYERATGGYWDYNLYTMVHGRNDMECAETIAKIARKTGIGDYKLFESVREFKKAPFTVYHGKDHIESLV